MRILSVWVFLLIAACATNGGSDGKTDEFVVAAETWKGAPIQDMVGRWGQPNGGHSYPSANREGFARWQIDWTQHRCRVRSATQVNEPVCRPHPTKPNRELCFKTDPVIFANEVCPKGARASERYRYYCGVDVTFNERGIITGIDAYSRRCARALKDDLPDLAR
jgi:hypothetical protein